ncbi:MAG TPA: hypothetical protein VK970_16920 [Candidatus Methylacidiphilales bacterium]|nr:hypothetical protein [Candidatus Methylacidiphilales bacterium]
MQMLPFVCIKARVLRLCMWSLLKLGDGVGLMEKVEGEERGGM